MIYLKLRGEREITDLEAINFFIERKLLDEQINCDKCREEMKLQIWNDSKDGFVRRCISCRKRTSVTNRTIFDKSKLKLTDLLKLIFYFAEEKTVLETSNNLHISKNTVTKWFKIIRIVAEKNLDLLFNKIGGENRVVQIDETVISKRKYNRGRIIPQQWLFGAIDTINGHFILKTIDDRSRSTLRSIITECITENTTVHSDMWSSYMSIFRTENDYRHETVNHSRNFVNPTTGVHTNNIENLWMLLKQSLRRKYLRNRGNLDLYLAEFCLRAKFKNNKEKVFYEICDSLKLL